MKSILSLLSILILASSCKENAKSDNISDNQEQHHTIEQTSSETRVTFLTATLDLTHCESAVYDSNSNVIYASLIGNREPGDGSVAKIDSEGNLINKSFVSGLNDPKGIAITKDKLYVSDVTELVEADLKTGEILKKHSIEGTTFLNDVAIDNQGNVYVSDTSNSEIYKLDVMGNFTLWLADEALDRPNGLLIENNTMYVASWGSAPEGGRFSKVDMTTKKVDTISSIIGNLDGVRTYDDNRLIISDWQSGNIHLIDSKGKTEKILTVGQSVGDIAYIKDKNLLLLPMNKQSRLLFYKIES